ncbi:helix-turn-helix domain-containing protein [Aquiflexum sp.]|uniref:helix-turn-helix domain-containing protein n=1 Tax=Aquiflexum sp. TaxID=1872584 RepID=UPI0035940704
MLTNFYPVSQDIAKYVSGIILLEGNFESEFESLMTVKGTASMGIPLGEPFQYRILDQEIVKNKLPTALFDEPVIFGQTSTYGKVSSKGIMKLAIVVFTPLGLYTFLQDDVAQYTNAITPVSRIATFDFPEKLLIQLRSGADLSKKVELIEQFLKNHLNRVHEKFKNTKLDSVLEFIFQSEGLVAVPELAKKLGRSKRSLETDFKRKIGLSPKLFCRIVRFHAVYNHLNEASESDFFGIVLKFGYSDQSHFIKDFVEFTGFTPKKYLQSPSWLDIRINLYLMEEYEGLK